MKRCLPLAILLGALCFSAEAQTGGDSISEPRPALPVLKWNVCPGEGCHFGTWTAEASVPVYEDFRARRAVAKLVKGVKVTALTGVIAVYKAGTLHLDKDRPEDRLEQGDTVFTYTYYGEGVADVWFHGRFHPEFDISWAKWPKGGGCNCLCAAHLLDLGKQIWWVKIQLPSGLTGWVNAGKAEFDGICAPAD